MKKITLSFFLFLIISMAQAQGCGVKNYLSALNSVDPGVESSIPTEIARIIKERKLKKGADNNEIITIPVVFNLVFPSHYTIDQGANVHTSVLQQQVNILNARFAGSISGVDTKIRFCIARKDINGNDNFGVKRYFGKASYQPDKNNIINADEHFLNVDTDIKQHYDDSFPTHSFLNIWVVNLLDLYGGNNLDGYSSIPIPDYQSPLISKDGVVLNYLQLNKYTASHEIGHWLGLFHVFESNQVVASQSNGVGNCNEVDCEAQGDFICDTDRVIDTGIANVAPGNCKGYNCDGQISNIIQNYMDYNSRAREHCYKSFTQGQKKRMRDVIKDKRPIIYNNSILGLNDYCSTGNNNGTGYISPLQLFCRTCYEPGLKIPEDYGTAVRSYKNNSKGNLYITSVTNGFIHPGNGYAEAKIRIYERNCLNFNLKETINDVFGEIYIINDNAFIVKNYKEVILYIKNNNVWFEKERYDTSESGHNTNLYETKKGFYLALGIYNSKNDRTLDLFKYDYKLNEFILVKGFDTKNGDFVSFNITFSDTSFFIVKSADTIEEWEIDNSGFSLTIKGTLTIPLIGNYVLNGKNNPGYIGELGGYKNYLLIQERRFNNRTGYYIAEELDIIKIYKKNGENWVFHQEINLTNNNLKQISEIEFIDENHIAIKSLEYRNSKVSFIKKDNNNNFSLMNLNHLYVNSTKPINNLCTTQFSINTDTKEVLLDNMMLKLSDVLQIDTTNFEFASEPETTSYLSNPNFIGSDDTVYDYEIFVGGNTYQTLNLNNKAKKIIAKKRIIIKPNVIISGGNVVAKVSKESDYNVCNFVEDCSNSTIINTLIISQNTIVENIELPLLNKNEKKVINIYPNPNQGLLYINNYDEILELKLYDSVGKFIFQKKNVNSSKLKLPKLNEGIYNLIIYTKKNKKINKKLIIQY